MPPHTKSLFLLLLCLLSVDCRRKDRPSVLALIPEDAPIVAWMPTAAGTIGQVKKFLATFERENLGDQVKALRYEWKKQYGLDPLDEQSLQSVGLDTAQPWAMAYDRTLRAPVYFLATKDPAKLLEYVTRVMKEGWLIDKPLTKGSGQQRVYVFATPFGNTSIEVAALRLSETAAWLSTGPGASTALEAWPDPATFTGKDGAPRNFQKAWKRAESDGSAAGAALRVVAKDSAKMLPRVLAERFAKDAELRAAVSIKEHRLELFMALLGAADVRPLFAEEGFAAGIGLPDKPVVVARSQMNASELFAIITGLRLLGPLLERAGFDQARLSELIALGTGAGALAIELTPQALRNVRATSTAERLRALLDAFPITAVAELKNAEKFDATLIEIESELKQRGFSATIDRSQKGPPVLKTASFSPTSQVSLSRRGTTLLYGIGPGAFSSARERLDKKLGMDRAHPIFGPLFEPHTSGVIVDVGTLVTQASALPQLIFGEQNALMKSFFGSTIKSFEHFQQAGVILGVEGPAHEPHPVIRWWLTTK
jgi:hypothetical protein